MKRVEVSESYLEYTKGFVVNKLVGDFISYVADEGLEVTKTRLDGGKDVLFVRGQQFLGGEVIDYVFNTQLLIDEENPCTKIILGEVLVRVSEYYSNLLDEESEVEKLANGLINYIDKKKLKAAYVWVSDDWGYSLRISGDRIPTVLREYLEDELGVAAVTIPDDIYYGACGIVHGYYQSEINKRKWGL